MNLDGLTSLFANAGVTKLYAKSLAENDNSKNQIYFAGAIEALNAFPSHKVFSSNSAKSGPTFKAHINFGWLQETGEVCPAPNSKLIVYSQYPEVRFSGFLKGCRSAPGKLLMDRARASKATVREQANLVGRVLFIGTTEDRRTIGFIAGGRSQIVAQFNQSRFEDAFVVFKSIPLPGRDSLPNSKAALLRELLRIHQEGWITSKQLSQSGEIKPCRSSNCGGFTLEAELGIPKNSDSAPDFLGWEIKQHSVTRFDRINVGVITLMTPEPTGGFYKTEGVEAFVRKFGYPDLTGRENRLNFGGIHKMGIRHERTGLLMNAVGFDPNAGRITDANGSFSLVSYAGEVAASWSFAGMFEHWSRKHANAAYIPSICSTVEGRKYSYGGRIRLAQGTSSLHFISAFAQGDVFYDPGIKLENLDSRPRTKRRSQFRVKSANIGSLYEQVEEVDLQ